MRIDELWNVEVTIWELENPDLAAGKRSWGEGPWQKEFDRVLWQDENTGYHCLVSRHPSIGFLTGYVGIPRYHQEYGRSVESISTYGEIAPHGGLEFADFARKDDANFRPYIEEGNAPIYWVGFDASKGFDLSPSFYQLLIPITRNQIYREMDYMIQEVLDLSKALHEINAPLTIDNYK